jgi:hypothetical protein
MLVFYQLPTPAFTEINPREQPVQDYRVELCENMSSTLGLEIFPVHRRTRTDFPSQPYLGDEITFVPSTRSGKAQKKKTH